MEDMLDQDVSPSNDGIMRDIWDAPELHNIMGADGKPFIHRDGSEGRYVFSFCMDGFNPFHLKQAGKKASVVRMYMICLNLPPEERYKLENMFLVGIIPGPHEPKKEEINHLLSPLVDDLLDSYRHGVWYSRMYNYKHGRYARSILALMVCDTPASRQVTGRTSTTSTHFCPYCTLPHCEIKNLDQATWHLHTDVGHRSHAIEWLKAAAEAERDSLFAHHGVHHSELLRLPYWSPIKHTAIDSMHLFFLILFKRHCTDIWGMDSDIDDGDGTTADPVSPALLSSVDVQRAFIALRGEPLEILGTFNAQTLKVLANSRGINMKGVKQSVLLERLTEYVSDYRTRHSSCSFRETQRQTMGWFDADDKPKNTPNDKELIDMVTATTPSVGSSFTVMDFNTAVALFETADDLDILRNFSRTLLVKLCIQFLNNSTKQSLNTKTKGALINKLKDAVHHISEFFGLFKLLMRCSRIEEGSRDHQRQWAVETRTQRSNPFRTHKKSHF